MTCDHPSFTIDIQLRGNHSETLIFSVGVDSTTGFVDTRLWHRVGMIVEIMIEDQELVQAVITDRIFS